MKTKSAIRNQLLQQRHNLSQQNNLKLSQQICDKILSSVIFNDSHTIASYISLKNEVDLFSLFKKQKNFVLPVVHKDNHMSFNQYQTINDLIKNNFGIFEPINNPIIDSQDINLCLVPLVGFNRKGDRLGMGGGYYDRYFETNKQQLKPTILAGIAYDFQEDDTIQAQAWDIPLDLIFTNKEVIYCD